MNYNLPSNIGKIVFFLNNYDLFIFNFLIRPLVFDFLVFKSFNYFYENGISYLTILTYPTELAMATNPRRLCRAGSVGGFSGLSHDPVGHQQMSHTAPASSVTPYDNQGEADTLLELKGEQLKHRLPDTGILKQYRVWVTQIRDN